MHAVDADEPPAPHMLVASLLRNRAAVTAGLTLLYGYGVVERPDQPGPGTKPTISAQYWTH